ncbi:DUF2514 family protein [Cupriavidus sp. RAF20_2]|uniref:DUF2514 family protein n=1 Tax=Cupriavidus sp. RAF20_2 TaxID=3233053 RepID=UPI003F91111A
MNVFDPRVLFGMVLALMLAYGGGRWQQSASDAAKYEAERTSLALGQARAQIKAVDDARLEEQRRTAAQTEIANAATRDAEIARKDALAAGAASEQLRQRIAAVVRDHGATGDTAATGSRTATGDPARMLAEVLDRADKRAGILAEYADAARIAGQACERAYDSLTR